MRLTASASSNRSFPQRGDGATGDGATGDGATATGATATFTTAAGVSGGEVGVSVDDFFFVWDFFGSHLLPLTPPLSYRCYFLKKCREK